MNDGQERYTNLKNKNLLLVIVAALVVFNIAWTVIISARLLGIEKVVLQINEQLSDVQNSIDSLQAVVYNNTEDIASLKSSYTRLYNEYRVLASRYNKVEDNINELSDRVDSIEEIVTNNVQDKFSAYSYYDIQKIAREGHASIKTRDEIQEILDDYFRDKDYEVYYFFYDERYLAYDYDILKKLLQEINWFMKHNRYLEEYYDCDDFTTVTMGIIRNNLPGAACMIMAISYKSYEYGHLQLLCIAKDGRIIFYDPTDGDFDILDEYDVSEMFIYG